MMKSAWLALALGAALGLAPAQAQDLRPALAPGAAPAPATLDAFKGLIGAWSGPQAKASFSPAMNGQMIGYLMLATDAGPRVEEIWILRPEGDSVLIRQKHFTPDLKGREEKDQWSERRLVAADAGHIFLETLTWVTKGDSLDLLLRGATPTAPPTVYSMTRVK